MYRFDFPRRMVIIVIWLLCSAAGVCGAAPVESSDQSVTSPNGEVTFQLLDQDPERLQYQVLLGSEIVIEPSRLGILIDGVDLGQGGQSRAR